MNSIRLDDLVGIHTLSGFDNGPVLSNKSPMASGYYEDANTSLFILDGITYMIIKDPDDGYRSWLGGVYVTKDVCKFTIPSHIVEGVMNPSEASDTIDFIDIITEKPVLSIGTDHSDDYYPSCVMYFQPENLAINNDKKSYYFTMREKKLRRILKDG